MAVLAEAVGQGGSAALDEVLALLRLERLEETLFRGVSNDIGTTSVFGGLVLGQALMAAGATVPTHAVHSLHGYFIRPGDKRAPILYTVERTRDGASFSTRSVTASQGGKAIFQMLASFQRAEGGLDHQCAMPDVQLPEQLADDSQAGAQRAIVFRTVDQAPGRAWMRADGRLPDDPLLHHALLAYASDLKLLGAAVRRHGLDPRPPNLHSVSLDHAMWFHRGFRFDDWLLFETDSPSASHARAMCRGSIFGRDGRLLASVAQEGLIRLR
ncbi:acyl-CoA thioesterase [Massilia cavernae]|nr:acyl-CoA thioesterase II [Massilia cavernae]